MARLCHITKEKISKKKKKNSGKTMAWKVVPGPYVFVKN